MKLCKWDWEVQSNEILEFWFAGVENNANEAKARNRFWFSSKGDKELINRFGSLINEFPLVWPECLASARWSLATIIAMDQFPRQIFRGTPDAYRFDTSARALLDMALARKLDQQLTPAEAIFFYMPCLHAENLTWQVRGVSLYRQLLEKSANNWLLHIQSSFEKAKEHQEIIRRFGRFPHRNTILGRVFTTEEQNFLELKNTRNQKNNPLPGNSLIKLPIRKVFVAGKQS